MKFAQVVHGMTAQLEEEIDLNTFLRLKESDLERLHIRQMGPRKKVLEEIDRLQTGRPRSNVYLGLPKHKLFENQIGKHYNLPK